MICSDSQAALKALGSKMIKSKLVDKCKYSLNLLARQNKLKLIWSPGHTGINGNEEADKLAKIGANLNSPPSFQIGIPLATSRTALMEWTLTEHSIRWSQETGCNGTRRFWGKLDPCKSCKIIKMNKASLRLYTGLATGHSLLRKHAVTLGLLQNSVCRGCDEQEETVEHLLCHCPAVRYRRLKHLNCHFMTDLEQAGRLKPSQLVAFANEVNWVDAL